MTLAKGLGGGVPIGALVTRHELGVLLRPGTHASTFGGNHLAAAAGCAVFDGLSEPGLLANVLQVGDQLQAGLRQIFPDCEVRGRGLLIGVALPADRPVAPPLPGLPATWPRRWECWWQRVTLGATTGADQRRSERNSAPCCGCRATRRGGGRGLAHAGLRHRETAFLLTFGSAAVDSLD